MTDAVTAPTVGGQPPTDDLPPRWLALPLVVLLALLVAASVVGVVAAVLGAFSPAVVITGTAALGAPLAALVVRALPAWSSSWSADLAAALLLAVVVLLTAWNADNHGEHLVADRDPGVYLTTARHLMDEGDVLLPGPVGPFAHAPGVSPNGAGFSPERDDGTLEPQFPHLTSVSLAMGGWIAASGLFLVTPILAGFGLLCLYAFACTLLGARWAAVAATIAGLTMPFTMFARDAYSEPITTVLVFGGLWLLHLAHRSGHLGVWLVAGLALGATCMARVDGYLYLAPVVLALVLAVRLAPLARGRSTLVGAAACAGGLALTTAVGLWDTATLTGGYFDEAVASRLPAMLGAAIAAGVVAAVLAPALWRREADALDEVQPTRALQGALVATAVGLAGFLAWGWWVRPGPGDLPTLATEGVNILSYLPQAATLSMRWLGWYFGPVPLAVGLAGLLWALLQLGWVRRPDPGTVAGLGCVLVPLLLYLWSPNITPDHPWAMRRFAAVALPGIAVGIAVACRALWALAAPALVVTRWETSGRRAAAGACMTASVGLAVASVTTVAVITWPTRDARAQFPMHERMQEICDVVEPDDAVLVSIDGILALMMSVPLGVWCDVPSAGGTRFLEPLDVARLAVAWEEEGRRLVVLSSSETPVFNTLRPAGIVTRGIALEPLFPTAIEPTLRSRPDEVVVDGRLGKGPDGEVTFYVYVIDTDRARRLLRSAA
jgi:hypothetical protein